MKTDARIEKLLTEIIGLGSIGRGYGVEIKGDDIQRWTITTTTWEYGEPPIELTHEHTDDLVGGLKGALLTAQEDAERRRALFAEKGRG